MRIVFMGTPDIAQSCLRALLDDGRNVVGVFTRQDKPVGRKQVLTPPPVKVLAAQMGIPVYQPATLKNKESIEALKLLRPDIVVVVAYGRILPPDALAVPKFGCINLHVSLLPKYRGAAPIQWAVINGEKLTGVSIMQMDEGLDTGPVLATEAFAIEENQTAAEVFEEATRRGATLLCTSLDKIEAGGLLPVPQQGQASYAPPLKKVDAFLDFAQDAQQLHNLVRGCNPWPLAWFMLGGKRIKVVETTLAKGEDAPPGSILSTKPLTVACGSGALVLGQVVPEGSRPMQGSEWAAGRRFEIGGSLLPPKAE